MKQSAIVIVQKNYFMLKKEYVYANFDVTHIIGVVPEEIGTELLGMEVLGTSEIYKLKFDKVIIAVPLQPLLHVVIELLLNRSVKIEDIVLLYDKPDIDVFFAAVPDASCEITAAGNVVCNVGKYKIQVETQEDLYIIKEVLRDGIYEVNLPFKKVVVVDIGLNIGVASIFLATQDYTQKVYSFEPFWPTFNRALENIRLNGLEDKISPVCAGLGFEDTELTIEYNVYVKGNMSIVRDNRIFGECDLPKEKVWIVDAAKAFSSIIKMHPDNNFLFKIDCEGAEYAILKRLDETGLLSKISVIVMEWHNQSGRNVSELETILSQNKFIYYLRGMRNSSAGMLIAYNTLQNQIPGL